MQPQDLMMPPNRAVRRGTVSSVTAALLAVALPVVTACAGSAEPTATMAPVSSATTPTAAAPTQTSTNPPATEEPDTMTTIRITVADQTITADLADNPTARDLAEQLPLTLSFRDFNRVEKIAELPRPLTMEGVPAGDDPEINDIGYYAPLAASSSTTATSATSTASSGSAGSATPTST